MTEEKKELKIDLGCGDNKREGFTGVDKYKTPSVDIEHDLFVYPWPFEDNSVDEVWCSHFFEHIAGMDRPRWIEELYRVLKVGAKATLITPYYKSPRATQDFTHQWPPVSEETYLYFNKQWRESNKLTHGLYDVKADFDFTFGYSVDGVWATRNEETKAFAMRHYWNAIQDLWVTLIKK